MLSVIIPCRNEAATIESCIASVMAQETPRGGFEVIVADGCSDDGTREILKGLEGRQQKAEMQINGASDNSSEVCHPVFRVVDNPGRIVSSGLNAAIRVARGELIVRMDAHTEYAPDYLQECVAAHQAQASDNVGGPWLAKGTGYLSRAIAAAFQSPFGVGGARGHDPNHEGEVDTVYLGCWRRGVFDRFGYFDEELIRNQDDEHNLRIRRKGGRIYQTPKIKSWYRPRSSLGALFQQYQQYGYWKVRVVKKHKLPASWRHLVPVAFVFSIIALLLLSLFCFLFSTRVLSVQLSVFSLVALLAAYAFAALLASLQTAAHSEWKFLPVLPLVFGCYHLGYGFGFLRGVLDFIIRRRGHNPKLAVLTR